MEEKKLLPKIIINFLHVIPRSKLPGRGLHLWVAENTVFLCTQSSNLPEKNETTIFQERSHSCIVKPRTPMWLVSIHSKILFIPTLPKK